MSDNKRIAKNTVFLYMRMIVIMGVSLYTSRVILAILGVNDFGLYNVVGGVVAMISFINGSLSMGTMRYLTYDLGTGDFQKLRETFNTTLYTHLVIGAILVILLETIGLYFVYNQLVIPENRMNAAIIVYHISVFTTFISISLVPYSSLIMAHEKMSVYAYFGIIEALSKLGVILSIKYFNYDRLITYAVLMAFCQLFITFIYFAYSKTKFGETNLYWGFNKKTSISLMSFSGWNMLSYFSETLKLQGYLVLLNMFFLPYIVAAQSIGNQVAGAMMQFVNNFRKALDPQIIKLYAAGNFHESKRLTIESTVLIFDLVLLMGLSSICVMPTIMRLWLTEVPPYAVIFTQWIIARSIVSVIDASFYTPLVAAAKVRQNSIISVFMGPLTFLILYILFKLGCDVMWLQYIGFLMMVLSCLFIKPVLLLREVNGYETKDFIYCFFSCAKVSFVAIGLTLLAYKSIGNDGIVASTILFLIVAFCVLISSYIFLNKEMRLMVNNYITKQVKKVYVKYGK